MLWHCASVHVPSNAVVSASDFVTGKVVASDLVTGEVVATDVVSIEAVAGEVSLFVVSCAVSSGADCPVEDICRSPVGSVGTGTSIMMVGGPVQSTTILVVVQHPVPVIVVVMTVAATIDRSSYTIRRSRSRPVA